MVAITGTTSAWSDRLPAVLVREVRQSLRGRSFRIAFLLVLTAGVVAAVGLASVGQITRQGYSRTGRELFELLTGGLFLTCLVQVPHAAFSSMAAEWDEGTYDMLALTNLGPRRIVVGKWIASLVQTCLHISALTPLAVFCFLLRGVGLLEIGVFVAAIFAFSAGYSALAIALASLSAHRVIRNALQGLTLVATIGISLGIYEAWNVDRMLRRATRSEAELILGVVVSFALAAVALGIEIAHARLAHPEENRSTGLRCAVLAIALAAFAWIAAMMLAKGVKYDALTESGMVFSGLAALFASTFVTESNALGRRVRLDVPRGKWKALLVAPFLPGGARALLLVVLCLAAYGAYYCAVYFTQAAVLGVDADAAWRALRCGPFAWLLTEGALPRSAAAAAPIVSAMPPALVAGHDTGPLATLAWISSLWLCLALGRQCARLVPSRMRALAMVMPLLLALVVVCWPLLFGGRAWYAGNPLWVIERLESGNALAYQSAGLLITAAAITLLLHVRSMRAGVREVLEASARARTRESSPVVHGVETHARTAS